MNVNLDFFGGQCNGYSAVTPCKDRAAGVTVKSIMGSCLAANFGLGLLVTGNFTTRVSMKCSRVDGNSVLRPGNNVGVIRTSVNTSCGVVPDGGCQPPVEGFRRVPCG